MGKKRKTRRRRRKQRGGSKKVCNSLFMPRGESWSSINNTLGSYFDLNHSGSLCSNESSMVTSQFRKNGILKGGGKNPLAAFLPSHVVDIGSGLGGWGKNAINTYKAQPSVATHNVTKGHYLGEYD
tara:strand:+ start:2283 stop:2660 length:378 start_codon:yes stop_codon:yes gene_type:complete